MNIHDEKGSGQPGRSVIRRRNLVAVGGGAVLVGLSQASPSAGFGGNGGATFGQRGAATGIELLGEIDQDGPSLVARGYFTSVAGFSREQVFFDGVERNEVTARFTFVASVQITGLQRRETVILTSAGGTMSVYLRDAPGGDFDNPAAFALGTRIASDEITLQSVLNVTAPNLGSIDLSGDFHRAAVWPFVLHGRTCLLGHPGLHTRLAAAGRGLRTDATTPRSIVTVAGNLTNPR